MFSPGKTAIGEIDDVPVRLSLHLYCSSWRDSNLEVSRDEGE